MDEKLRLDYEQTNQHFMMLADTRLKLLVFVPALSAIAMALLAGTARPGTEFVVGILGIVATVVLALYGLRNAAAYDAIVERGKSLEKRLDLPNVTDGKSGGGFFSERPPALKLLGQFEVRHRLGFALVYGTVFGGWVHTVFDSALGIIPSLRTGIFSIPLAIIGGVLFFLAFLQMSAMPKSGSKGSAPTSSAKTPSSPAKPVESKPAGPTSTIPAMPPAAPPPAPISSDAEDKGDVSGGEPAKGRKPRTKKSE